MFQTLVVYLDHNSFQWTILQHRCIDILLLYSGTSRRFYKDYLLHIHRHLSQQQIKILGMEVKNRGNILRVQRLKIVKKTAIAELPKLLEGLLPRQECESISIFYGRYMRWLPFLSKIFLKRLKVSKSAIKRFWVARRLLISQVEYKGRRSRGGGGGDRMHLEHNISKSKRNQPSSQFFPL